MRFVYAGGRTTPFKTGALHMDGALPGVTHQQVPLHSPFNEHAVGLATPASQIDGFNSHDSASPHFARDLHNVLNASSTLAGLACPPSSSLISNLNLGLDASLCQHLPAQSFPKSSNVTPAGFLVNNVGSQLQSPANSSPCSLYVKNLPAETDRLFLYEKFAPHGAIHSVKVLSDVQTGKCKGVGFVNYGDATGAFKAIDALHGSKLGDKFLHVSLQTHKGCLG